MFGVTRFSKVNSTDVKTLENGNRASLFLPRIKSTVNSYSLCLDWRLITDNCRKDWGHHVPLMHQPDGQTWKKGDHSTEWAHYKANFQPKCCLICLCHFNDKFDGNCSIEDYKKRQYLLFKQGLKKTVHLSLLYNVKSDLTGFIATVSRTPTIWEKVRVQIK